MSSPPPSRFAWRTLFARSRTAVFVVGGNRRLRYANAAWEEATSTPFAPARGMRISVRRSASDLSNVLAPPPEAWAGKLARARRAAPGDADGPPWWDLTFLPLLGDGAGRVLAVVGTLAVVGASPLAPREKVPEGVAAVRAAHADWYTFDRISGPAVATERLVSQVRAAAIGEMPVWVVGESGTGKESVARVIHHNGPRRERAFVGLACGGLQPYLIDGLLFGKGGASGGRVVGTLYLKDPHELPAATQQKVLDWCDSAAGPRLVCGGTKPPAEWVTAGRLATPFLTRYSAFEIGVPPLRARLDDLPRMLDRAGVPKVTPEVLAALRAYSWPGNLREFAAVAAKASGGPLVKEALPRVIRERHLISSAPRHPPTTSPTLDEVLTAVEKRMIENALAESGGHQGEAAERLGVFRQRLARRIAALGLTGGGG